MRVAALEGPTSPGMCSRAAHPPGLWGPSFLCPTHVCSTPHWWVQSVILATAFLKLSPKLEKLAGHLSGSPLQAVSSLPTSLRGRAGRWSGR